MDFFEAVEKRYSHKEGFLPTPMPREHLEKIARTGLLAPSGANMQSVRLVLLPDRAAIQPLCDIYPTMGLMTAPAVIALFTDGTTQNMPVNFEKEDYAAACENILLAATALDYAALWLDHPYFDEGNRKAAEKLLNAPEGYNLRVVIPLGLPDGAGSRRAKLPLNERMVYGKF
ncbi:MAG: nitroreductase family protein [Defluviitaleaceae bacterium]|nr:nitroreductase family protein [Defluviitaleaceae bacterium]